MDNERFRKLVGEYFRQGRMRVGLTQEQVYEQTGINISRVETGERSMNLKTFICLVRLLQLDPQRLCEDFEREI